ncbi:MAG: nucleotidyltransferase family protein [Gammaproteobacteria bacterium]|nr:nucleotidyltransferase family protein [Gammaproteobacteria bacterium]
MSDDPVPLKVGALVLAAGFSDRFGSLKLCAPLPNGQTVFHQTLSNIRQSTHEVLVITRPEVLPLIADENIDIGTFKDASSGMGATLAFGIKCLQKKEWDGCLICLADMPFIRPETYRKISNNIRPDNIVIPHYQEKAGNPVGFGRDFFNRLSAHSGDSGGRAIIKDNPTSLLILKLDDPTILQDIDTPEDIERFNDSQW